MIYCLPYVTKLFTTHQKRNNWSPPVLKTRHRYEISLRLPEVRLHRSSCTRHPDKHVRKCKGGISLGDNCHVLEMLPLIHHWSRHVSIIRTLTWRVGPCCGGGGYTLHVKNNSFWICEYASASPRPLFLLKSKTDRRNYFYNPPPGGRKNFGCFY